jgi:hypothetical protein
MGKRLRAVFLISVVIVGTIYASDAVASHCAGTQVGSGANLAQVASNAPARTTFCLHAGTYTLGATAIPVQSGDQFIGEGRASVFIRTSKAQQLFKGLDASNVLLQGMDISGAVGSSTCKPMCGRGIWLKGINNTLRDVYVHHNTTNGAGGMGDGLLVENSEFAFNGSAALLGCCAGGLKSARPYTVTSSYIHHNTGNGVWQDVCGFDFIVSNNTIVWNSRSGVRYEHNQDCFGSASIHDNLIQNNNTEAKSMRRVYG